MTRNHNDWSRLSDDELRKEARSRGLPIGRTLSREQVIDLLEGESEKEETLERPDVVDVSLGPHMATLTMAKLYAAQGLEREAADVCRAVLSRSPGEERARRLLERLSGNIHIPSTASTPTHRFPPPHGIELSGTDRPSLTLPERYGSSHIVVLPQSPTTLFVLWDVDDRIDDLARHRAGSEAVRVLRVFSAWRDKSKIERRTRDEIVEGGCEEIFVEHCPPGAMNRAAVGWRRSKERFFPVCHSGAARTPRRGPSPSQLPLWGVVRATAPIAPSASTAIRLLAKLREPVSMVLPWEDQRGAQITWPSPSKGTSAEPEPPSLPSSWSFLRSQ